VPAEVPDGGVRRGTDVLKALALGAKAVLIGRPYLYGLAAFGGPGVERVLAILRSELVNNMGLAGVGSLKEIDRSLARMLSAWRAFYRFLLERDEAEAIVAEMEAKVRKSWRKVARSQGVSDADCEVISGAFVYPGFSYALQAA
jgi:hypothetical protein